MSEWMNKCRVRESHSEQRSQVSTPPDTAFRPIYKHSSWKHPKVGLASQACDWDSHIGPHTLCWEGPCSSVNALLSHWEIVIIFLERVPHFHFALGPPKEVSALCGVPLALLLPPCPSPSQGAKVVSSLVACRASGVPSFWGLLFNSPSSIPVLWMCW